MKLFLFALTAFIAFNGVVLYEYFTTPEIHVSYFTRKCVRLVDYKGKIMPCSEAKNYRKKIWVWVE